MGQISTRSIICPKCTYIVNLGISDRINIDTITNCRERIINKTFFVNRCPACDNEIKTEYSVLLESTTDNMLIYYLSEAEIHKMDNIENISAVNVFGKKLRIVNNQNELLEKILIQKDGLDDMIIEYIKSIIEKKATRKQKRKMTDLYYAGAKNGALQFVAPVKDGIYNVNILESMYDNYYKTYNCRDSYKFTKIGRHNINEYVFK